MNKKSTRGFGIFEQFLAKQRAKMANKLIPAQKRGGRILDIGCGIFPLFLQNTEFSEKYGMDKMAEQSDGHFLEMQKITLKKYNIIEQNLLPFEDGYFDVVTMLAVFEHIEPKNLVEIMKEVNRVLKAGGMFVMTTPACWTDGLLRFMAKLKLISLIEIDDHRDVYNHSKISVILQKANFPEEKLKFGFFEVFMNLWVTAIKGGNS